MTIDEVIEEYEKNMKIKLSTRERIIFTYAFTVAKNGWDVDK